MNYSNSREAGVTLATRSARAIRADVIAALGVLLLVNLVTFVPGLREATIGGASLRTFIGLPALLILPGYVVMAITYPGRRQPGERASGLLDRLERVALWFGMSIAVLPMFGVVLGSVWSFTASVVVTGYTVALLAGLGVATIRRLRRPPAYRAGTPVVELLTRFDPRRRRSEHPAVAASTVVLAIAIVVAVGAVGFVVATPYQSGDSSTLYLVTENETGAQVASGYPTTMTVNETDSLTVGIRNHEDRREAYTVIATLEVVQNSSGGTDVVERAELARIDAVIEPGEDWTKRHTVSPPIAGEQLRLHYYLYRGDGGPATTTAASAYRDAYLWVDVNEP